VHRAQERKREKTHRRRKTRAKQIEYHELLLGESDPELVGDAILVKDALKHALGRLLAQLHEVGAKQVCAGKTGTERKFGNQMNTEVNHQVGAHVACHTPKNTNGDDQRNEDTRML
jgi:hypothetical protein